MSVPWYRLVRTTRNGNTVLTRLLICTELVFVMVRDLVVRGLELPIQRRGSPKAIDEEENWGYRDIRVGWVGLTRPLYRNGDEQSKVET